MESRLKLLRIELKLTVKELAKTLNLSKSTISLIENGKRNLTDRTMADLERLYNVNLAWLKTGDGPMFKEKSRAAEIAEITANMFRSADDDTRYVLHKIVESLSDEQLISFRNYAKYLVEQTETYKGE